MNLLLAFDRALGKIEVFLLSLSLLAMLFLALYAVVYRNLVQPLVLNLQEQAMNEAAATAAEATPPPTPSSTPTGPAAELGAPIPAAGSDPTGSPGPAAAPGGGYLGDLAEETGGAAPSAPPSPAGSAYLGDLAEAPAVPPPAPAPPAAAAAYLGDLEEAPATPPPAAPPPAPAAAAYLGDLTEAPPPAADSAFLGDLAGSAAPPPAPAVPPATDGYLGDLAEAGAPPVAAGTAAPPAVAQVEPPAVHLGGSVLPPDTLTIAFLKWFNFGWIDVVTRHLLLWIAFFGAAVATSRRKHIAIDALSRVFSEKARSRLRIGLDLLAALTCVFLGLASWQFLLSEHEAGTKLYDQIPSWVGIGVVPGGFALMAWHFGLAALLGLAVALGIRSDGLTQWEEEQRRSQEEAG